MSRASRTSDYDPSCALTVAVDEQLDVTVSITGAAVRFTRAGLSPHTRRALLDLLEAMRADAGGREVVLGVSVPAPYSLRDAWRTIGEAAELARPVHIVEEHVAPPRRVLVVEASTLKDASQLAFLEPEIRAALARLGHDVDALRFRVVMPDRRQGVGYSSSQRRT